MDTLEKYANNDGTYTSPKNGKTYKSLKAFRSHWFNPGTGGFSKINATKHKCQYCSEEFNSPNIKKHENSCYLNPENLKKCAVCNKPIKNYKHSKGTCSRGCANTHWAHIKNKDERLGYQALCFRHHGKKCLVCGEDKIVAAHHVDHDHNNNDPKNLVPLCPTHHQYVHSRYKDEVRPIINKYINSL